MDNSSLNNSHDGFNLHQLNKGDLVVFLILTSLVCATIFGNMFVILIILLRRRLYQNVTNCFIISLASADLLLGALVLPFAVINHLRGSYRKLLPMDRIDSFSDEQFVLWPYGRDWCDTWNALDVLSCTASILSLCVIAVERYIAISDPFNYQRRMTHKRTLIMVAVVWIASMLISFPAIYWWRYSAPNRDPKVCNFSDDRIYLFLSSCISFYIPLFVMIFVYWKIYRTANTVERNLSTGRKVIHGTSRGDSLVIGVHRGGPRRGFSKLYDKVAYSAQKQRQTGRSNHNFGAPYPNTGSNAHPTGEPRPNADSPDLSDKSLKAADTMLPVRPQLPNSQSNSSIVSVAAGEPVDNSVRQQINGSNRPSNNMSNLVLANKRSIKFKNLLHRFATERRAARTLGIIMGVFIFCWLPFFVCNTLQALIPEYMQHQNTLIEIVTWLGYVNSSINPFIYAYSLRDIRKAFVELLVDNSWCSQRRFRRSRGQEYRMRLNNSMGQSFDRAGMTNSRWFNKRASHWPESPPGQELECTVAPNIVVNDAPGCLL